MTYEASWRKIKTNEIGKINKREGQVWFGLRELLLNPKCSPYYEITEHRLSQLSKVLIIIEEDIYIDNSIINIIYDFNFKFYVLVTETLT